MQPAAANAGIPLRKESLQTQNKLTGTLETLSIGEIDQYDSKRYRYIEVKSKLLPKLKMRLKVDYPMSSHIPKDILVPGNKYNIIDAKVFNLSRSSPSWITIRAGRIQVHKTAEDYLSYKKYLRKSKRSTSDVERMHRRKRRKRRVSSSMSCSY